MKSERQIVMLIDDNMANLTIGKNILKDHYQVFAIPSAAKLFDILEKVIPDLILLDIEMSEIDGYEAIKKLKADKKTHDIPVVLISAPSDMGSEPKGLNLGAIDYVFKPFSAPLLLKRMENHLATIAQNKKLKSINEQL
jgi:putative two-component system response regulator